MDDPAFFRKGIRFEFLRRFFRQPAVSVCHVGAGNAQLAHFSRVLDPVSLLVNQVNADARTRLPQRTRAAAACDMHQDSGHFRGAVELPHPLIPGVVRVHLFSGQQHIRQRECPMQPAHHAVHGRRHEHAGDLPLFKQRVNRLQVFPLGFIRHVDASAAAQGEHDIQLARHEANPGDAKRPRMLIQRNFPLQHLRIVEHPHPVNHTLGLSGGA